MKRIAILLGGIGLAAAPAPAQAGELFGGLFIHDIDSPLTKSDIEGGVDVQLGWRGGRFGKTPLQPYVFAALNTAGETHYGAAGISARFGDRVYIRPALGLAVHTGSSGNFQRDDKIAFGSRVLFAPELAIGARLNERVSMEATWLHLSHGQLFGRQNPGIDNIGFRINVAF